ncbi:hypothetical protein N7486_006250 [Penicillium sp. IBT 16267x]|nr:hypothetical protein N7486_006250 [Penicillium sp. IBT 16267x]
MPQSKDNPDNTTKQHPSSSSCLQENVGLGAKYGKWQARGRDMQECFSDANKPYPMSTALENNVQDLIENGWKIEQGEQDLPIGYYGNLWIGLIQSGIMFIEIIERRPKGTGQDIPQMSDLTRIAYAHWWPLESLRNIYFCSVEEESTKKLCRDQIYTGNGLSWVTYEGESEESTSHTWEYGTPEYQALLGTRIGRVVGFLVLSGFEQGTRRVSRIVTFHAKDNDSLKLSFFIRFDIEPTTFADS